jgi:hypothetical protein
MKNITPEQLEEIEYYAEDQYTLEDLFDELNISKKLMKDERVLQAFEIPHKCRTMCFMEGTV